jgi:hypothetical protein
MPEKLRIAMAEDMLQDAIELRVEKTAQLFHSLDPYPFRERDLDRDAEDYIVDWASELDRRKPIAIVAHVPETSWSGTQHGSCPRLSHDILPIGPKAFNGS